MSFDFNEHSHIRQNPLTGDWVMVSPHRTKRPWQGKTEDIVKDSRPEYDPTCYLCAGNVRANGEINPQYSDTYVFQNDFAALQSDVPEGEIKKGGLLKAQSVTGECRVICFSPRHDLTLAEMTTLDIRKVVDTWVNEFEDFKTNPLINYVQIFENKGEIMGCSNPHPHGQIWASSNIPVEILKETEQQKIYFQEHGKTLLENYVKLEILEDERIVVENNNFLVVVPFWATWPFETLLIPKRAMPYITEMTETERDDLADIVRRLTTRYDNLFKTSFPYSAGIHQAPTQANDLESWHWHIHFYPPLLRSATVKKFMVGYELLANPQRDITPESAAKQLRNLSEVHFKTA
jgi:UDPglucose--hexose-1-phosphate uridylyltransferase